jgi:hypothetical protein
MIRGRGRRVVLRVKRVKRVRRGRECGESRRRRKCLNIQRGGSMMIVGVIRRGTGMISYSRREEIDCP